MRTAEIFDRLIELRGRLERDVKLSDSDNALLWDVAVALGLTEDQAEILSGDQSEAQVEPETAIPEENPHDFSHSGLGIGGLAYYEEPPFIPTVAQAKRFEELMANVTTCRRCGQSDVIDGAMFTTLAGSGICDDCV